MKRMLSILFAMIVVLMLTLPCVAASEKITITDASAQPGETVYLRVALQEELKGDSMGIRYTFDSELLKDLYKNCTWERDGVIQDFDYKQNGVWATSSAEDLMGDICTLAFKVRDGVTFAETKVACYVVIKNGDQLVGEYTVEATVSMICEHAYGQIISEGVAGHSSTCEHCGQKITNAHKWQEKEKVEDPDNKNIILQISVCSVCGEQKQTPIEMNQEHTDHTEPTSPTEGDTDPFEPTVTVPESTAPSFPTKPQDPDDPDDQHSSAGQPDTNQETKPNDHSGEKEQEQIIQSGTNDDDTEIAPSEAVSGTNDGEDSHEGHDHGEENPYVGENVPKDNLGNDTIESGDHEGHQHGDSEENSESPNVGAIVAAVVLVALMVGLPIYIFKGKKKI